MRQQRLAWASLIVGVATLLSRVLGLVRDILFAVVLGAGSGADAFFLAFKIPNFLRRLFAEGAFAQAFVPVLSDYHAQAQQSLQALINAVFGRLLGVVTLVTALGVVAAPALAWVIAWGFHDEPVKLMHTGQLLRITFPYLLFISLTAFCGAILNVHRQFAPPALAPVILNLCLIAAACWGERFIQPQPYALAWAVLIAGVLQWVLQLPFLYRLGVLPRPSLQAHPGVRRIVRLMLPALLGVGVSQINLLLDALLASLLEDGSVGWLYYSDRLSELPLGLIGIAVATVVLPALSSNHALNDRASFQATLSWGVKVVVVLGLPASMALGLLAQPLIITLFQYGQTSAYDALMAAQSLRAYALGVVFFMLIKVLASGFFAREVMGYPVKVALIAMLANMLFNLALVFWLAHAGLALATALSAILNTALLARGLWQRGFWRPGGADGLFYLRSLGACGAMALVLVWANQSAGVWLAWGLAERVVHLSGLIALGGVTFFAASLLLGIRPGQLRHA